LWVNDDLRQEGLLADMIWGAAEIISEASKLWRLAPGDLIFTGTPEGVGPLRVGDRVRGDIEDVGALNFTIAAKR
jgi:fumarylpyruvate hydrolase